MTGTPGGATIITTIVQIVSNVIDYGIPVRSSVDAPGSITSTCRT